MNIIPLKKSPAPGPGQGPAHERAASRGPRIIPAGLDLRSCMNHWVYCGEVETSLKGMPTGEKIYAGCYALRRVVYCARPADPMAEVMDIYVPEEYVRAYPTGEVNAAGEILYHVEPDPEGALVNSNGTRYTARTAPILYQNSIDGYREGGLFDIGSKRKGARNLGYNADTIREGYVLVGIGARGTDSASDGTAPACITDLKAGVRFLKANRGVIPGNTDRIYATGASAGGGAVCVLGASGNSELYRNYLEDIGAVMDAGDDIYGVLGYCPITNLDSVDAAYEWLHRSETSYIGWEGQTCSVDTQLHEALAGAYDVYLLSLGLDLDEFEAGFVQAMNESVSVYVERYVEDAEAFVEENSEGLTRDEEGRIVALSKNAFVEANLPRFKAAPASDPPGADSKESALFGNRHFSAVTGGVLDNLAYDIAPEYEKDLTPEQRRRTALLSPMALLSDPQLRGGVAPFWRINNGTKDGDFGSVAGYTIVSYLNARHLAADAVFHFVWGERHGCAELSLEDLVRYIDSTACCTNAEEDREAQSA